jgi:hypothetical protein
MQKNENKLMAENTSKEISHHADELESAVHKTAHIPAWVIAKLERSSTDLSDVTHYLDGDPKFAQGGGIVNLDKIKNNIGEVLYKFIGSLNKEQAERMLTDLKAEIEFELKTQSTSARYSRLIDEQNLLLYRLGRDNEMKMAQGGGIKKRIVVVWDEGYGKIINNLFNQWNNVRNQYQYNKWVAKVKETKFGTYGTIPFNDVLNNFEFNKSNAIHEVLKKDFLKEVNKALVTFANGGGIDKNLPVGQRVSSEKINKFIDYVYGFYGKGGIYARDFNGGLTKAQITKGVNEYLEELDQEKTWGGGDSLDRERVREYLESKKFADGGGVDNSKKRYILKNYSVSTDDVKMVDGKEEEIRGTHHNSTYSIGKTFYSKADLVEFIASKVQTNRKLTESDFKWNNERKEITISILGSFTHNSEPKVNELKKFNKGEIELIKKLYTFSVDAVIFTEYKNGGSTENEEDSVVEFRIYKDGKFAGTKKELWSKFQERKGRLIDPTDYFRDEDYTIPYFEFEPFDDNKNMRNYFVMKWDYKNEAGLDYPIEVWVAPHYVSDWMEKGGSVDDIDMNEVEKSAIFYTDETRWSTKPTIAKFEKELAENKELLNKLERKEISPAKIVGGGYKSSAIARKIAFKYLKEKVLISERAIEILKERGETFATGGGVGKKSLGGFIAGALVGAGTTYILSKNDKSKDKKITTPTTSVIKNKPKKVNKNSWKEDVLIDIDKEGFDYAFANYSDYKEVKDPKFHQLKKSYVGALQKLEKYVTQNQIKDSDYNITIADAIDKEGLDYAVTGYHNWKGVKDAKTQSLLKQYIVKRNALANYIGLKEKFSDGGTTPKQQKKIGKVMHEFKEGDLKTSAGTKVTNPKQAVAIALSEAGVPKKGWGHKKSLRK